MPETLTDPITDELRAVRDEHAARFNYDVEEIFRDIQAQQEASGREYVRLPPRRVVSRPRGPARTLTCPLGHPCRAGTGTLDSMSVLHPA